MRLFEFSAPIGGKMRGIDIYRPDGAWGSVVLVIDNGHHGQFINAPSGWYFYGNKHAEALLPGKLIKTFVGMVKDYQEKERLNPPNI